MPRRIALAYSGGLDTTTMVPWLQEHVGGEIVCVCGDVGQGDAELAGLEEKAMASGAVGCEVVDLKRTFVEDYVWPTMLTGATYEGRYLLGTAMARPPIAKAQVEVARKVGADALAHGCTGKGNDQVRFEATFAALAPDLEVIAPWRHWELKSREDCLDYVAAKGVPCDASASKIYSRDANLWHISHEGGELEDPAVAPPAHVWMRTVDPLLAPDVPEHVTLAFEHGRPVAVNGEGGAPEVLLQRLNDLAAAHGVGRIDIVENRLVGMKSRGCYETPGGTVIAEALFALESLVHDRATLAFRRDLGERMAMLVYDGQWFTPLRESIVAAAESIASRTNGEVTVQLCKGRAVATSRTSPEALYAEEWATFGADDVYDQSHAEGFIRLHSLPSRIRATKALAGGGASVAVEPKAGAPVGTAG